MTVYFLVTSAIQGANGRSGQLTTEQRLQQTLQTANSIRNHCPQAEILLLEGGKHSLSYSMRQSLRTVYTDILDYTQCSFIEFAHNNVDLRKQGITVIKGPCETYMLKQTCQLLSPDQDDRIFKISGRYCLNEHFDLNSHLSAKDKYLMLKKLPGLIYYSDPTKRTYSEWQYSTRCYSFAASILPQAIHNYENILNSLLNLYARDDYIDIEHMTYLTLDPSTISDTERMGLSGVFAENPLWRIDE